MCAVSAISNHYFPYNPNKIYEPVVPGPSFDEETRQALRDIIKRLDEIDKKLGEKDCLDERKAEFFKAIGYVDNGS